MVFEFGSTSLVEKIEVVTIIMRKAKYGCGLACMPFLRQPGSPVVKKFNFDVTFRVPRLYM